MIKIICTGIFLILIIGCSNSTVNLPVGYTLPEMPDETINSATIAGIDANTNGVRDDVEIFIYTNYSKLEEQKAQMQMARNIQESLLSVKTKGDTHIWANKFIKANDCHVKIFGNSSIALKETNIILSKTLNTIERVKSDRNIDLLMSGEVFPLINNENPCE